MSERLNRDIRVDCQGESEGEYPSMSRLLGGGVLLPDGCRVDPTRYPNVCVVSTRRADVWDVGQDDGFVIPLPFRPKLSDIFPMLRDVQQTGQAPLTRQFVLRPVEQTTPPPYLDEDPPLIIIPDLEFRVVGTLRAIARIVDSDGAVR